MHLSKIEANGAGAVNGSASPWWDVEIHLKAGEVLRDTAAGDQARGAVEAALARQSLRPDQITGIVASPSRNGRAA